MKRFCPAILILMLTLSIPARPADSLTVQAGYAAFYDLSGNSAYIEFYYGLYRYQLGFIGSDTLNYVYAGVFVSVRLFDESGMAIDSASTYFLAQVRDTLELSRTDVRLFDYLPIKSAPGKYLAEITIIDDVSKARGAASLTVTVPDYRPDQLAMSDIELAYEIREVSDTAAGAINRHLVKEGRLVVPNPTGVYQMKRDSVIYAYSELYGLDTASRDSDSFTVRYRVKDAGGNLVYDFGQAVFRKPGNSAAFSNALDIGNLESGRYNLLLEATDLYTKRQTVTAKEFSIIDPNAVKALNKAEVELMINIAWYHLSEAEKIQIRKLTSEGQVNFLKQFWREMDDDPSTPENPVYDDAVRRFAFAGDNFPTHHTRHDGWKTDRGRVYITYGPYDNETELILPAGSYPLIKWEYYNIEGGVIFIFASDEVSGIRDYQLVHSTHSREIHNPYWMDKFDKEAPEEQWQHRDDN
jgi:GWxTD domain-containing protein